MKRKKIFEIIKNEMTLKKMEWLIEKICFAIFGSFWALLCFLTIKYRFWKFALISAAATIKFGLMLFTDKTFLSSIYDTELLNLTPKETEEILKKLEELDI